MDIEPGTIIAQRYRVQRQLGRGGMGEVFAAENVRTGRVVAVKLLRADTKQKSSAVARFRREARAAGAIHSDYVTQVLDVEDDPDHGIVIVFELLEGESLIDRLKRTGPMNFDEIFPIVEQVWIGLADAHASGVIHRDLKPSNVFLEKRPDGGHRVKILDFGISKLTNDMSGETLTEMGQNLGTFSFMPPEQIGKAKTVDHRADIYSCATLIYQAMSGQLPYAARNILMIVELKAKAEPRPLSQVMDTPVDPRLEHFLAKSLKRAPEDRYQSAVEALEAWRGLRQGGPASEAAPATIPRGGPPSMTDPGVGPRAMPAPVNMPPASPMTGSTGGHGAMHRSQSQPAFHAVSHPSSSISNLPSMVSVTDSSSDGGDNVATLAIPMARVAEALAQRRPAATQPGTGLPRLHEDQPNMGTQLMNQGQSRATAPAAGQQRMGTIALPSQSSQPMPAARPNVGQQAQTPGYAPQSYAKPVAATIPGQPVSAYAPSSPATPIPSSSQPMASAKPTSSMQGGRSGVPSSGQGGPSGLGGTARVAAVNVDDLPAAGDLQTSVYRRDPQVAATVTAPRKRSRAVLIVGMLLFLVLGFAIVAAVVGLVTHRFPFLQ